MISHVLGKEAPSGPSTLPGSILEYAASHWSSLQRVLRVGLLGLALALTGCVSPATRTVRVWNPPCPVGQTADSERCSQLRVVTYNIWGMPTWISGASPDRYAQIAEELERQNADIILLQEVWSRRSHQAVPAGGEWSVASAEPFSCFFRRNGLVCLSRFPVVQGEFRPFRSAAWPDSLVEKGALKITVELGDSRRLNVWNVHLQAGRSTRARSRQIGELAAWVSQARDGQIADIIAGDFNCTPESSEYDQLVRELGQDVCGLGNQRHFATHFGAGSKPGEASTLDYVFVRARRPSLAFRAGFEPVIGADQTGEWLSDHLGLGVDLTLDVVPVFSKLPARQGLGEGVVDRSILLIKPKPYHYR